MKQYSMFQAPYLAFFSRSFYQDVAKNWGGIGSLYLFLILAVGWLALSTQLFFTLTSTINTKEFNTFLEQVPTVNITQGKLSIDKKSPYTILSPSDSSPLIVFDTTGQIRSLEDTKGAKILLTEQALYVEKQKDAIPWNTFASDIEVGPAKMRDFIKSLSIFVPLFVFVCGIFIFVGHLIQVLIYGLIGLIMDNALTAKLGYVAAVRLAVMAITPAIVLSTLFQLLHFSLPLWGLLSIPLSLGYLYFGYRSALTAGTDATESTA